MYCNRTWEYFCKFPFFFSFSQTVAMTRGSGRGFITPRGGSSYRGSSGRGSSWNDRGGRGGYSSGRGGGGRFSASWNSNSSFDRPRYQSSSGDRYGSNSRNRPDDSNYRRSYRSVSRHFTLRIDWYIQLWLLQEFYPVE